MDSDPSNVLVPSILPIRQLIRTVMPVHWQLMGGGVGAPQLMSMLTVRDMVSPHMPHL